MEGNYLPVKNSIRTSAKVAKLASKQLKSGSKTKRSVAGAALVNRKKKP